MMWNPSLARETPRLVIICCAVLCCRLPNSIPISCSQQLNLDGLLARLWYMMALVRVYTKRVGQRPDFSEPVVLSQVSELLYNIRLHEGSQGLVLR